MIPVIVRRGAGTRLWPVYRETCPKPLLRIIDGESLLQKTFARAAHNAGAMEIVIVTNRDTYFLAKDDCV